MSGTSAALATMKDKGTLRSSRESAHSLEQGRSAFREQAWAAAFTQLSVADSASLLEPDDLLLFAQAALLIGKEAEGWDILARAHQAFVSAGHPRLAARCAFWLGFH